MRFFVFFVILFFVELGGFTAFSENFGFFTLVLEIILSGLLGVFLIFSTLSGSNESIVELLRGARDPKEVLASNFAKVFGGILLIIPGLLSDCLGILLYLGVLDSALASFLGKSAIKTSFTHQPRQDEIIDVEVIEEKERIQK